MDTWGSDLGPAASEEQAMAAELEGLKKAVLRAIDLAERYMHQNDGRVPQWMFEAIPRIIPQYSIELYAMRMTKYGAEVLMLQRPQHVDWPGEWHVPGTPLYALDAHRYGPTLEGMMQRLDREVGFRVERERLIHMGVHFTTVEDRKRGPAAHHMMLYWLEEDEQPSNGTFYRLDRLPEATIEHHLDMLRIIRQKYRGTDKVN